MRGRELVTQSLNGLRECEQWMIDAAEFSIKVNKAALCYIAPYISNATALKNPKLEEFVSRYNAAVGKEKKVMLLDSISLNEFSAICDVSDVDQQAAMEGFRQEMEGIIFDLYERHGIKPSQEKETEHEETFIGAAFQLFSEFKANPGKKAGITRLSQYVEKFKTELLQHPALEPVRVDYRRIVGEAEYRETFGR